MKHSVVPGRQKHSANDEMSPQKKLKLESEERTEEKGEMEENEEEEEEDVSSGEFSHPVPWQKIEAEGLDCDYAQLFTKKEADHLFQKLEEEVVYSTGRTVKKFYMRLRPDVEVMFKDCVCVCFRGRSQSADLWKDALHTEKGGHVRRRRSDILLLWHHTSGLAVDSNVGAYSRCCHRSNRSHI